MAKANISTSTNTKRKARPSLTPEAKESHMISLAVDLAEKQLMEGTASSQVITHYLKLGTTMAQLEKKKLEHETEMLQAKTKALQSTERVEELYAEAIKAMRRYSGQGDSDDEY